MELSKDLAHYRARLDLWWAGVKRNDEAQKAARRERSAAQHAAWQDHQAKLAAGEVTMAKGWYQHPNDPPGFQRWWDGGHWTEHTQQSHQAAKTAGRSASGGLALAGAVTFLVGLLFWPLFLATFVIGIVLATKPGRGGDGALLIVLSVLGPIISIAGCAALITSGS